MSCLYSDFDGKCEMFEPGYDNGGCDEDGFCMCDDDECPEDSCDSYESLEKYNEEEEEC